ncbi:MAG: hypothetical protein JWO12_1186 [Frankiales bacterium]|nr:hypothetical protein [Frankiales bacterium]
MLPVLLAALVAMGTITLPSPEAARVQQANLIKAVGGRPDRLLQSFVPGPVVNAETVRVGLAPSGAVSSVTADQRLTLTGTGDYAIRERGPARSARSLSSEPPPVTRRGAVVWQGFSPGSRALAASLVLDPAIEAPHLPLTVAVSGSASSPGQVTVTVTNTTAQPADLPTGSDVAPAEVAGPLDAARAVARHPTALRLPTTSAGLPATVEVSAPATVASSQAVPLRVTGSLSVVGGAGVLSGPAVSGSSFAGTLGGVGGTTSVTFTLGVTKPGALALSLTAVNALNPAQLAPPRGLPSWRTWAGSSPPLAERRAALDLLVEVAASGARASSYSPYLGADLRGTGSTTFSYSFVAAAEVAAPRAVLRPKWGALSLAGLGLLALLSAAAAVWRRS